MNSFIKLNYDELETIKDLVKLYTQSNKRLTHLLNISDDEVIKLSNKITYTLINQYREE
jgi:hypothetical protein